VSEPESEWRGAVVCVKMRHANPEMQRLEDATVGAHLACSEGEGGSPHLLRLPLVRSHPCRCCRSSAGCASPPPTAPATSPCPSGRARTWRCPLAAAWCLATARSSPQSTSPPPDRQTSRWAGQGCVGAGPNCAGLSVSHPAHCGLLELGTFALVLPLLLIKHARTLCLFPCLARLGRCGARSATSKSASSRCS
jgi:hypothetical protein